MEGLKPAKEALSITMQTRRKQAVEAIDKACSEGRGYCSIQGWLDLEFADELHRLGYTTREERELQAGRGVEPYTLIAWTFLPPSDRLRNVHEERK